MLNAIEWNEIQVFTYFFVFIRATSLMLFLPILGDRAIPPIVKILFGVAFSAVLHPLLWSQGLRISPVLIASPNKLIWAIVSEVMFGMLLGFVARWVFDAIQFAGHFIGTSIGFSIATVLDPHTETQTIALAELQYLVAAMLFLALNGHHFYLNSILQSYKVVALGGPEWFLRGDEIVTYLIRMTSEVLVLGVKLSAPIMVVMLIINITFGVLARAVPQMNVLAVSFTTNIFIGLIVVLISLPGFVNMVSGAFEAYTPELDRFMRLFGG